MRPRIQSQNVTYLDTTKPHSINMYTFYSRGMGNRLSVGGAIGSEGGRMEESMGHFMVADNRPASRVEEAGARGRGAGAPHRTTN